MSEEQLTELRAEIKVSPGNQSAMKRTGCVWQRGRRERPLLVSPALCERAQVRRGPRQGLEIHL